MPLKKSAVFTLFILFSLCINGVAAAAPRISAEHPVFDFGTVRQGRKIDHSFVIRNRGDAPLVIEKTRTSCGCTVANVTTRSIAPGGSSEIKITFDSGNFAGKIEKTVSIDANDPNSPVTTLTIKGIVTEELVVMPKQLNFGSIKVGASRSVTVNIENRGDRPVRLSGITSSTPQITIKGKQGVLEPGGKLSLSVTASPRDDDRYLSGNIIIATDSKTKPTLVIPAYGSVTK
jgi:hypothetical protein